MQFTILEDTPLPDLLDEHQHIKLLPAAELDAIPRDALRLWCHVNARYGLPTQELIAYLKKRIAGRNAIEIGSGYGDLAYHLGIPATDSWIMTDPKVAAFYRTMGQPVIDYPPFVEKIEALAAIEKYKPEIVIASWVTRWIDPDLPMPAGGGSIYGVKEDLLLATGVTYIFIGNLGVHQHKQIRNLEHQELILPFVRSRAQDPSLDRIMIWNEKQGTHYQFVSHLPGMWTCGVCLSIQPDADICHCGTLPRIELTEWGIVTHDGK